MREQIEGLMTRVEIEMTSNPLDDVAIRKVYAHTYVHTCKLYFTINGITKIRRTWHPIWPHSPYYIRQVMTSTALVKHRLPFCCSYVIVASLQITTVKGVIDCAFVRNAQRNENSTP